MHKESNILIGVLQALGIEYYSKTNWTKFNEIILSKIFLFDSQCLISPYSQIRTLDKVPLFEQVNKSNSPN